MVNLIIIAVIVAVYASAMSPQLRTVLGISSGDEKPLYSGPAVPYVAIQCNVYSGGEYIEGMLEVLSQYDVKITWNLGGIWVDDNPELAKKIADAGHEIGNHGYLHKNHSGLTFDQNIAEIQKAEDAIYKATGKKTVIFAPPSGDYNGTTVKAAKSLGYVSVMWTADLIDWRDQDAELFLKRTDKLEAGGMLLSHPTAATLETLPRILDLIEQKGFSVVPVGQLLAMED
ncbi:MAG: polysaccharide deacetylase family protein, partial [Christensenellales bacterium]|jgi:peptidoglycan/xylan/chitin deacetylase (PgdA/CDA1 family)